MSDNERTELADWLAGKVAAYLNIPASQVGRATPLADYGLDSVFALALAGDLEHEKGILVEPTIAWDYPTVNEIAGYVAELQVSELR